MYGIQEALNEVENIIDAANKKSCELDLHQSVATRAETKIHFKEAIAYTIS
jgi:hypothetical protein